MIVINPLTAGLITGGLTGLQGFLGYQGKQQDHANQVAFKSAQDEFSRWSSSMQAQQGDLNNQYSYWQQKVNWGQEMAYANSVRNFELGKAINSAEDVFRTRASAGADYIQGAAALSEAFAQQSMADAMSMYQYKSQALRSSAAVQAAGQEGVSTDRRINDYARQVGDMETLRSLNAGFRDRQFTREQAGMVANYLNQYNSQRLYEMQEVFDPIMPFAPLPTLVNPMAPSMVGGAPSAGAAFLGTAIGMVNQGMSTYGAMGGFANSGKRTGTGNQGTI